MANAIAANAITAITLAADAIAANTLVANANVSIPTPPEANPTHMHQLSCCLRKPPNLIKYHSGNDDVYSVEENFKLHHVPVKSVATK